MKIKEITSQHRRDYVATMECESCGHEYVDSHGYDDSNYHQNVIPKMKCPKCGETSPDNCRPLATKYPDGHQV